MRVLDLDATDPALFVEEVKDTQLALYQVNAVLVVWEVYEGPRDGLLHVLFLLQLEHMLRTDTQG